MLLTFFLSVIAWVFFRVESVTHALNYLSEIFSLSLFTKMEVRTENTLLFILVFVIIEWIGRESQYAIENIGIKWKRPFRLGFYYALIVAIFWFAGKEQQFIYFQF